MNEVLNMGFNSGLSTGGWIGVVAGSIFVFAIFLAKAFRRVVEPNEVHIVQSRRTTMTYGKKPVEGEAGKSPGNSYYEWPHWWPVIGVQRIILPLSVFDQKLTNYEAYDIGKVPFVVDVVAFFRISEPSIAAKRILDLHELKAQLESILQGAVRTILAKHEIEDIMMERSTFGKMFTDEVADQLKAWGVSNVKNIELMDIRDGMNSQTVSNIMAKKESVIDRESRVVVAENSKLAETAERDMAVELVKNVRAAEINRSVEVVKADEDKQTVVIRAEGQRQQEVIDAEATKQKTIIVAEGDLQDSLKEAEGILAIGTSNAEAKRLEEMATVSPQIALADEIGSNDGYQEYLIKIRNVEKDEAVGIQQAVALQDAGIKVIVNSGDVHSGMNSLLDVLTTKGGTHIAGMVEAIRQTDEGSALLNRIGLGDSKK